MKKLAIIGRGTAGVLACAHFTRYQKDIEIELHFDADIKPQPVGEGSTLVMADSLYNTLGFTHSDLPKIDGTFKSGVYKKNWGKTTDFVHNFYGRAISYHFNASKLQNFIINELKDRIKIFDHNVTHDNLDADFIFDCSGKPNNYDDFIVSEYIPVNSVHVTQCYWDMPRFFHTLAIARPYGWVFGIPLQNRCSIGYMYNNNINTLEEVKEDVKTIFEEYNLIPSDTTNSFSFGNYYRKSNFNGRVVYSGNASFFLEPLEATSIMTMDRIQRIAHNLWFDEQKVNHNEMYLDLIQSIQNMIMLHYYAGSRFNTPFWEFAQNKGQENILNNALLNDKFKDILKAIKEPEESLRANSNEFGSWGMISYRDNFKGLGIFL